ncbi:hypothetical protein Tco_0515046 [Tanacetum coccineum]
MNVQAEINRLQEMLHLRNSNHDHPVDLNDLEGSGEGDMEIDLLTEKPLDTLLMGDEESEVTSGNKLECDMPVTIPLPTTDVREENFDINSPLGEHSNDPLGDDSKPRSYDVTFSNSLFDFNDDYTLCNDNPLFDEEFEDISSLDPPKSAPLNYEPLGNPDSVSRSLETSDLNLEELTAEIGLDDSIPTETYDGYYDSEGDILFLEHLLIEETFSDPTPTMLHKKSTLLVTPPPASKQSSLKEVERFDPFFLPNTVG